MKCLFGLRATNPSRSRRDRSPCYVWKDVKCGVRLHPRRMACPTLTLGVLLLVTSADGFLAALSSSSSRSSNSVDSARRHGGAVLAAAAADPTSFSKLATPAAFADMLAHTSDDTISVVKFQSPYCRSCRQRSSHIEGLAEAHPDATFYSLDLVLDGKAAGRRMKALFKEHGVSEIPFVQLYRGGELLEAGPDRSFLESTGDERCVITAVSVSCEEEAEEGLRPLQRLGR